MKLKIFFRNDCPNCPAAKALGKKIAEKGAKTEWYDMDNDTGLSEAVYYDVLSTPSLIITDDEGNELKAWRGNVPTQDILQKELKLTKS